MDGQNFENQQNAEQTAEPVGTTESVVEPAAAESAVTGSYQDTTYTGSYQDNTAAYTGNVYGEPVAEPASSTPGLAIGALVLGIIGILTGCCGCLGAIFGIAGLIMAIISNKQTKCGVGTAALICSIIAIVLGVIMGIVNIVVMLAA